MAAEEELKVEEGGGGKGKLIIVIAAVVVILGGAAAFFMMGGSDEPVPEEGAQELTLDEEPAAESAPASSGSKADMGTALYVAMPRPFVFNVPGASRDRLVQIKVQLLVRGAEREELAKKHIPLIEGGLLRVFSGANADDLATVAGKEALKVRALQTVQEELNTIVGQKVVENVLFTGFVMQ
ncbi:flagellar basal body-associated protein FliL [Catenovulum sp. SM1970]|uniref:flagellar basal body-associated protein FliL n=1 Tax=Marinifaba aquimaris TaxID=2741323 RepID=UPI0015725FF8|nr:flagellar basal body-associated protein FliL [Marinifaba aquimaris]NTS76389.1 flagellar basal body-associated protein FliL [Marinifaba aquimaris]